MSYISPSAYSVGREALLTSISIANFQKPSNFVASQVFPNIQVESQYGEYFVYDMGYFNRCGMEERKPGTESAGGTWKTSKNKYYCPVYAFHNDVDDKVRLNASSVLQYDKSSAILVSQHNLQKRERMWVANSFTAGDPGDIWDAALRGGTARSSPLNPLDPTENSVKFWNHADSTPIQDIRFMSGYMGESSGIEPNILTINRKVYNALIDHPDILGRVGRGKTDSAITVNQAILADLFDVEHVYVLRAIKNVAKEGQPDDNKYIGGNHALLTYRPPTPEIMTPCAGYTFNWSGFEKSQGTGIRINKIRMEIKKSDRIEIETSFAQLVTATNLGGFFSDIVE